LNRDALHWVASLASINSSSKAVSIMGSQEYASALS
jgi:hypothetical protein